MQNHLLARRYYVQDLSTKLECMNECVMFSLSAGCNVTEKSFCAFSGSRRSRKKLTRNQTRCTLSLSEE